METIKVSQVEGVRLLDRFNSHQSAVGTLYLTPTHLIFVDPAGHKETWILYNHIGSVERLPLSSAGAPLQIRCKTFLAVTLVLPRDRDCHEVASSLTRLSQPGSMEELYCFQYSPSEGASRGWDLFDLQSEYLRMGVPNSNWQLIKLNKDYELCQTYPRHLFLPTIASKPVIVGSSKFRSRGRLPALSYLHRTNQAALCRCSQPLSGFSARCLEDEQLLDCIRRANPGSPHLYVVDTRPKINAMANKAAGKGYENENNYTDIKFFFHGIENIHVMRSSLNKLVDVCELRNPSMQAFLSGLESSSWLKHIKAVLDTSIFIAKALEQGVSVLVHCSDGWDRTAQTCSLAGLLLDPYYRTIQGFQALVEKEWLSFGHMFSTRCGQVNVEGKEVSPVFTQFLDAVWQLIRQFPRAFQYNERFLLAVHDHVHSCQFGTFLGNCEKDRLDLRLHERTHSLWVHLSGSLSDYTNPLFSKETEVTMPTLKPSTAPQLIRFWRGMYNRFETGVHPRDNCNDLLAATAERTETLQQHRALVEKRIVRLCELLGKTEEATQRKLSALSVSDSTLTLSGLLEAFANASQNGEGGSGDNGPVPSDQSTPGPPVTEGEEKSNAQPENKSGSSVGIHTTASDAESGFEDWQSSRDTAGSMATSTVLTPGGGVAEADAAAPSVEQLAAELASVALDWQNPRDVKQCVCAAPLDHFTRKHHCRKCGEVRCSRCLRTAQLGGLGGARPAPVCKSCMRDLRRSPSSLLDPPPVGTGTSLRVSPSLSTMKH